MFLRRKGQFFRRHRGLSPCPEAPPRQAGGGAAGALGRPVWLLNRFATCWRWLLGRDDSPWYPGLRRFRQIVADDWAGVIARVAQALHAGEGAMPTP
jgi:hypothetical protein